MTFIKKNYKKILAIILLCLALAGVGIAQILLEEKPDKSENKIDEAEETKEIQTNNRDETIKQLQVITDYINIREKDNVNSKILGKVYKDEIYTILEETGSNFNWYLIETQNGIKGYIAGKSGDSIYVEILPINETIDEDEIEPVKPNTPQNNQTDNNSSNNNTSNNVETSPNENKNEETEEPTESNDIQNETQLQTCSKTCEEGYVLKNENSVDCYCEKVVQEEVEEEPVVIDATKEAYCEKGTLISDGEGCKWTESIDQKAEYSCPEGYIESYGVCRYKDLTVKYNLVLACSNNGYLHEVDGTKFCRPSSSGSTSLYYKKVCPKNYTLKKNNALGYYCAYDEPYAKKENNCPDRYKGVDVNGYCMGSYVGKTVLKYRYACPSGYTLKDDKCYKD